MALYGALLRPLYPGREIRAALVYTEAPLLVPLDGAALAVALASLGLPDSRRRDRTDA
jgi:ATP-dependent helicase/nuclease subunit A